jgi:hypothetical protein
MEQPIGPVTQPHPRRRLTQTHAPTRPGLPPLARCPSSKRSRNRRTIGPITGICGQHARETRRCGQQAEPPGSAARPTTGSPTSRISCSAGGTAGNSSPEQEIRPFGPFCAWPGGTTRSTRATGRIGSRRGAGSTRFGEPGELSPDLRQRAWTTSRRTTLDAWMPMSRSPSCDACVSSRSRGRTGERQGTAGNDSGHQAAHTRTPQVNPVGDRRRRHVPRAIPTQLPRARSRESGDAPGRPSTQQVENHRSPATLRAVPPPDQVVPLAQSVRMGPLLGSIASTGSPSGFQPFSGPWLRFSGRSSGRYRSPWEHDGERPAPPVCAHSTGKAECIRKQEAARRRR